MPSILSRATGRIAVWGILRGEEREERMGGGGREERKRVENTSRGDKIEER